MSCSADALYICGLQSLIILHSAFCILHLRNGVEHIVPGFIQKVAS